MARTVTEIEDEIITQKNAVPELAGLTSTSNTAIWRLWVYVTAVVIHLFEKLQDVFKTEIVAIIESRRIGTLSWYVSTAKDFQLGDTLQEFETGDYGYPITDTTKQIIKRASAKVESGEIKLKVAKETAGAGLALSAAELVQFSSYMELVKFAGTEIEYISLGADELTVECDLYYDGVYATGDIETAVQEAIEAFLEAIPFDGVLKKNALIEAVRDVAGVTDIVFNTIEAYQSVGPVTTAIGREYETIAGYINLETFTVDAFIVDAV